MPYYDHFCNMCGWTVETSSLDSPFCPNGHGLMRRKFTPPSISVKNGTPRFHGNQQRERMAKHKDERSEFEHQERQADSEIKRIDEETKHDYAAGELSYKHGHGSFNDERQMAKEDAARGEPHGPEVAQ